MRLLPLLAALLLGCPTDPCAEDGDVLPERGWFEDVDGDGYGAGDALRDCRPIDGRIADGSDCDDRDARIHPGAAEQCDGLDQDCDGTGEVDGDGDGFLACAECDDGDGSVFPGAAEACDGRDEDCSGIADDLAVIEVDSADAAPIPDEGTVVVPLAVPVDGVIVDLDVRFDVEHSWVGDVEATLEAPDGTRVHLTSDNGREGDGYDGTIFDDEAEQSVLCDASCAPFPGRWRPEEQLSAFDGASPAGIWKLEISDDQAQDVGTLLGFGLLFTIDGSADADGDGVLACGDCDDADPAVPAAAESCNELDDDCDGAVDEGFEQGSWWPDVDGDGYGDRDAVPEVACAAPDGWVGEGSDCDDGDAAVHPGFGNCSFLVRGLATYEDVPPSADGLPQTGDPRPIRRAKVEVVLVSDGSVIGEGWTGEDGAFTVEVPRPDLAGEAAYVSVQARRDTDGLDVWVLSSSDVLFAVSSPDIAGATDGLVLHATADPADGRRGAAFNILDQFLAVTDWLRQADATAIFPNLVLRYEVDKDEGTYYSSGRSTGPFGDTNVIELLGQLAEDDDGYDDSVIAHEIGHYIQRRLGSAGTPGGSHTRTSPSEPGLALGEGFATFVGNSALGSVDYLDTRGPDGGFGYSVEAPPDSSARGMGGEAAVSAALWDLTDSPAGDDDPFAFGIDPLYEVLTGQVRDGDWKSLHAFLDGYVALGHTDDGALDAALGDDTWFQVGRPAAPSFPVAVHAVDAVATGTVDGTVGRANEPSGRRHRDAMVFHGVELAAAGDLTATLTADDPSDVLRLRIESPERGVWFSEETLDGVIAGTESLAAGNWLVYVWAEDGRADASFTLELDLP